MPGDLWMPIRRLVWILHKIALPASSGSQHWNSGHSHSQQIEVQNKDAQPDCLLRIFTPLSLPIVWKEVEVIESKCVSEQSWQCTQVQVVIVENDVCGEFALILSST
jgi:hypothetical protein